MVNEHKRFFTGEKIIKLNKIPDSGNKKITGRKKIVFMLVPSLLILSGIILIFTAAGLKLYGNIRQERIIEAYVSAYEPGENKGNILIPYSSTGSGQQAGGSGFLKIENGKNTALTGIICLLNIPRIDLTLAVTEGVDSNSLRFCAGHFPGTALPGQNGNFSVTGHRNYVFGEHFNRLDEIEAGDSILVDYNNAEYTYVVTDVLIVEPHETWVIEPTSGATITLITCTPKRIATHRLVIKGTLRT